MYNVLIIPIAFLLDLCLGDPRNIVHPVTIIGKFISFFEKIIRSLVPKSKLGLQIGGCILALIVPCATFVIYWGTLYLLSLVSPIVAIGAQILMCYRLIAAKCLKDESMKVYDALVENDINKARLMLSYIVGRDTTELGEAQIAKGAVETIAENTTDGVVAPMFYMLIFGAPLAGFYKAVNTLDSMVGYKNEKYMYFGTASAKLDDVLNFIPARLAAMLMIGAAWILKLDAKRAFKVFLSDRYKHKSPNSAQTESVCAGALNIELGGNAIYFGKLVEKPTIGQGGNKVQAEDIKNANKLMLATSGLCAGLMAIFALGGWLICS